MTKIANFGALAPMAAMLHNAPDAASAAAGSPAPAVIVKEKRIKKNGQTRPEPGTKTGFIWDLADALKVRLNRVPTKEEVWEQYSAQVADAREATTATQFGRWIIFNGFQAQIKAIREQQRAAKAAAEDSEKTEKKAAAEAARTAKEAEKVAKRAEREAAKAAKEADKKAKEEAKATTAARLAAPVAPVASAEPEVESEEVEPETDEVEAETEE